MASRQMQDEARSVTVEETLANIQVVYYTHSVRYYYLLACFYRAALNAGQSIVKRKASVRPSVRLSVSPSNA